MNNLGKTPLRCVYQLKYKDLTRDATYIGSTKDLKTRIGQHIYYTHYKNKPSYDNKLYSAIRELGMENFIVDTLYIGENHSNIEEQMIRTLKPSLNCAVPGRTKAEYYADNLVKSKQDKIIWRYMNANELKEKDRERYQIRKEYCNNHSRLYYHEHKARLLAAARTPWTCVCGSSLTFGNKAQHLKSEKHKAALPSFLTKIREKKKDILRL